jgi:tripartite-type tricarboxylate transporter receptor subunit TctC
MTTVPYKGTGPAMTDLIGGQVDLMCDQTTNTTGQIEAKKVKAYAVTTSKRLTTPALKDLPTLQEAGLKDFEVTIWHGLYAPKGTPPDALKKINNALKAAMKDPDFIKKQEGLGAVLVTDKRVDGRAQKFVAAEIAKVYHQGRRRLRRLTALVQRFREAACGRPFHWGPCSRSAQIPAPRGGG